MKDSIKVLCKGGEAEITEKRSRFIATVRPVKTEEEAAAFVEEIRKKYFDARHNPYAWVIGDDGSRSRQSDDGEPSQTAGIPILNVIRGSGVTDACIVVTRYFGGTLLGTGGLFRAYTKAAEEGLGASIIVEKKPAERWKVTIDYPDLGKIENLAEKEGFFILGNDYSDKVRLSVLVPAGCIAETAGKIREMTSARAKVERLEQIPYAMNGTEMIIFEEESLAIPKDG